MMQLDAWITLPEGSPQRAGEIAFSAPDGQGRYQSAFRYDADWLRSPHGFALDPAHLPLTDAGQVFSAQQLDAPLMVLEDALPDAWGRRLLILRHNLPRNRQNEPWLLQALGGNGLGALQFCAAGSQPTSHDADAGILDLDTLARAALQLEQGQEIDADCRILLAAGSSPGGARPKALVRDGDTGKSWIAKFSSQRDQVDEVGLEATGLALARLAGLETPDFRLAPLANQKRALLVRRFDLSAHGGRHHMLSLRSLLAAGGYYVLRYADLLGALRKHSQQPETDAPALFRQMVFNALFGNTDDHLKNFWILHGPDGYRLSPAFDLLPDVGARREHVLIFDLTPLPPKPKELVALGRKWGIPHSAAVVDEVLTAMARFAEIAHTHAVPPMEIDRFTQDIQRRCGS